MISLILEYVQSLGNPTNIIIFCVVLYFIFKPRLNFQSFPFLSDYNKQILCTKTKREAIRNFQQRNQNISDIQEIKGHINFRRRASFESFDQEQEKYSQTQTGNNQFNKSTNPLRNGFSYKGFHSSVSRNGGNYSNSSASNSFFSRPPKNQNISISETTSTTSPTPNLVNNGWKSNGDSNFTQNKNYNSNFSDNDVKITRRAVANQNKETNPNEENISNVGSTLPFSVRNSWVASNNQSKQEDMPQREQEDEMIEKMSYQSDETEKRSTEQSKQQEDECLNNPDVNKEHNSMEIKPQQKQISPQSDQGKDNLPSAQEIIGLPIQSVPQSQSQQTNSPQGLNGTPVSQQQEYNKAETDDEDEDSDLSDPLRFLDDLKKNNNQALKNIDIVKCNQALQHSIRRENFDLGRKIFTIMVQNYQNNTGEISRNAAVLKMIPILTYTLYFKLIHQQLENLSQGHQNQQNNAKINASLKSSIIKQAEFLFDKVCDNETSRRDINNVFINSYLKIAFFDLTLITQAVVKQVIDIVKDMNVFLDNVTISIFSRTLTNIQNHGYINTNNNSSNNRQSAQLSDSSEQALFVVLKILKLIVQEQLLDSREIHSYQEKYAQLFSQIATTINKFNMHESAFEILQLMRRLRIRGSLYPYQMIAQSAAQMSKHKLALEILRMTLDTQVEVTTIFFNDVMNACYKANDFTEIINIYETMTRENVYYCCRPDILSYSFYIRALIRLRQHKKGLSIFYELVEKPEIILFDTIFFNNIIQDLNETEFYEQACGVFDWLIRSKYYCPSTVTYNIMIMIHGNIKQFDAAWNLFRNLKQPDSLLQPTINTYINILQVCAQTFDYGAMVLLYKEVMDDINFNKIYNFELNNNFFYSFIQRLTETQAPEHLITVIDACFQSIITRNVVQPYIYVNFFEQLVKFLDKQQNNFKLKSLIDNIVQNSITLAQELNREKVYLPQDLHAQLITFGVSVAAPENANSPIQSANVLIRGSYNNNGVNNNNLNMTSNQMDFQTRNNNKFHQGTTERKNIYYPHKINDGLINSNKTQQRYPLQFDRNMCDINENF